MRFIRLTFVFAILFAIVVCTAAAHAAQATTEKEPTLEETLQWIQAKLKETPVQTLNVMASQFPTLMVWAHEGWLKMVEKSQCSWEECKVDFIQDIQIWPEGEGQTKLTKYTFLLKDLDSNSVKITKFAGYCGDIKLTAITLKTLLNKETINYHNDFIKGVLGITDGKCFEFSFFTTDELAERLAKAWQHAIKLCGGNTKKEIF